MLKKIRNQNFLFPSNKTMKKNERRTLNALTVMPNLALEFEFPATGCTYAGVWSALTAYMCTVIPQENLATMQGILHGVYWGLGSGCGSLFGGILIQRLGAPTTFWIFAAASGVNLVIFVVAQKVCVFLLFQRFYITIFLQISEYIENMSAKSIKKIKFHRRIISTAVVLGYLIFRQNRRQYHFNNCHDNSYVWNY